MKRRSGGKAALLLGMMAALGGISILDKKSDHSQRESNRSPFTPEEVARLATLSGKEKKSYVKQLKAKYK